MLHYWCRTTTKTRVFASLRNSHRTSQLTIEKHSFLSKCWFTISYEHNNSFHLNLNLRVTNVGVNIIIYRHHSNFQTTATFFIFFSKCMWPPNAVLMKPRVPHYLMHNYSLAAGSLFVILCFLLREKKSFILSHFSKSKFLCSPKNYAWYQKHIT